MHNRKAPRYIRVVVASVLMLWTLVGASVAEPGACLVALDGHAATQDGVMQLAAALRASAPERPVVAFPFAPATVNDADPLASIRALLSKARRAYTELDSATALASVHEGTRQLAPLLVGPEAVSLAAELHRLEGLTQSYLDHASDAARSFALAWALDPGFAPTTTDWPPAARLAYADAVATRRQHERGTLVIEVEPAGTRSWLDGKPVGIGPVTLAAIQGGEHWLVANAPGHEPFAAIVHVEGHARLTKLEVRLVPTAGSDPGTEAARALQHGWGTTDEAAAGAQLASLTGTNGVIVVASSETSPTETRAWFIDRSGVRRAAGLLVSEPATHASLAQLVESSPTSIPLALPADVPTGSVASPWYVSWVPWTAAAAIVGGAAATYFFMREDEPERVRLLVGRP